MIQRCISALKKSTLKSKAKRNETENFISERQGGSPERDYGDGLWSNRGFIHIDLFSRHVLYSFYRFLFMKSLPVAISYFPYISLNYFEFILSKEFLNYI